MKTLPIIASCSFFIASMVTHADAALIINSNGLNLQLTLVDKIVPAGGTQMMGGSGPTEKVFSGTGQVPTNTAFISSANGDSASGIAGPLLYAITENGLTLSGGASASTTAISGTTVQSFASIITEVGFSVDVPTDLTLNATLNGFVAAAQGGAGVGGNLLLYDVTNQYAFIVNQHTLGDFQQTVVLQPNHTYQLQVGVAVNVGLAAPVSGSGYADFTFSMTAAPYSGASVPEPLR